MTLKVYVHDEIDASYDGKKGHVQQRAIVVADHSEGVRVLQMIEIPLIGEMADLSGKCKGKVLTVAVAEIGSIFAGRVRFNRCTLAEPLK